MILATKQNYTDSFRRTLAQPVPENGRPVTFMVLFYRAECGLKALFSDQEKIRAKPTDEQMKTLKTHNLGNIVSVLKVPASALGSRFPDFRLVRERTVPPHAWKGHAGENAHTVWRYGMEMESDDERKMVEWLNRAVHYVNQQL